ncbi:MAG: FAD-binding oxidoreductase [Pseudomonadota bacterium]|nr:FAD-binding oxidoreductase [Pseudomonadota bacterium]
MTESVTIVGAGMVGICTALSLAERGINVRIIDKAAPAQGATFGNAGIISPWSILPQPVPGIWKNVPNLMFGRHKVLKMHLSQFPRLIPWGLRFMRNTPEPKVEPIAQAMFTLCEPSIDLYRSHLQGTGHEDLVADAWYVHAFRSEAQAKDWFDNAIDYRLRRKFGANVDFVANDELHKLEPALGPEFTAAVLVKDQARARSPEKIALALLEKARKLGVQFEQTELKSIERDGSDWTVHCTDQTFKSNRLVLAAGAWTRKILKPLGIKAPLMAERGYHVQFQDPGVEFNHSVMDVDAKLVASSMADGMRVAGASEFCDIDAKPDPKRQALLTKQAKVLAPDLDTSSPSFWHGHRPSFPDSLPMIGEYENQPGLFACFGHSHYGLMMAPKSGEILSDVIAGRKPNMDLSAYSPMRFS